MKLIPLSRGLSTVVDEDVYEWASKTKWHACQAMGKNVYAVGFADGKKVKLHRLIAAARAGEEVDHINGDSLDNRKDNLRCCSHAENMRNQKARAKKVPARKGVYYVPTQKTNPWRAVAWDGVRTIHLGYFPTEEQAYETYRKKAKEIYGEFFKE